MAGMAENLSDSDHTSAQQKIQQIENDRRKAAKVLGPNFGHPKR